MHKCTCLDCARGGGGEAVAHQRQTALSKGYLASASHYSGNSD